VHLVGFTIRIYHDAGHLNVKVFNKSPLQQVEIDFFIGLRWKIHDFMVRDALKFVKVLKKKASQMLETSTDIHPKRRCL